jgi:fatty-acyl-CoA synthase
MRAFTDDLGVQLVQGSGMTETSPVVTVAHPPRHCSPDDAEYWQYRSSAGRLLAGVEARIVDEDGNLQPADGVSAGEVEYRGGWITGSYYGGAAPEKFHDGWLRTGDIGMVSEDGYLSLLDRSKDVIKSGGEWISSVQLENALLGHPEVADAAVIAIPDDTWGERPLACVVQRNDDTLDVESLRRHMATATARWQVPEYWAFIACLPRTSVGKHDKRALREAWQRGELTVIAVAGPSRTRTSALQEAQP